jgi:hypothetical protein
MGLTLRGEIDFTNAAAGLLEAFGLANAER